MMETYWSRFKVVSSVDLSCSVSFLVGCSLFKVEAQSYLPFGSGKTTGMEPLENSLLMGWLFYGIVPKNTS